MSFPRKQDLRGCALAILRIQDVYRISAEKIASGKLSDNAVSPEMRTVHCLELGHITEHWKKYEEAYGWFTEAWGRLSPLDRSKGMKSKDVLQYLIWTEYKVRDWRGRLFFSIDLKCGNGTLIQTFSASNVSLKEPFLGVFFRFSLQFNAIACRLVPVTIICVFWG